MSEESTESATDRPVPRRRGRKRRLAGGVFAVLSVLALLVGASVLALIGRPLSAPDWLRARIEARLNEAVPGLDFRFGDVRLLVQSDALARIVLTDVDIRTDSGAPVATLADLEAGLAPAPLLRGEVALRAARLSGAMLSLRRDEDGRLGLALGDVFASGTRMPDFPTIIAQVDAAVADPRLAGLQELRAEALTIRYEDARAGRGWTADGGRLSLTREDGRLRLAGDVSLLGRGDVAATLAINAESVIGETSGSFGLNLTGLDSQDIASQSPALAWLEALRAPISGALRGTATEDGQLGALNATLQIGEGVLQPNARTRPIPFQLGRTYFSYDPATTTLTFDEITVASALGTMVSDGRAVLHGVDGGWPDGMTGQFRVTRFEADPEGFLDRPLTLAGAELDWQLDFRPFRYRLGRLRSTDPALPLRLSGELAAESDGWRLAVDGQIEELSAETLLSHWPEAAAPPARRWVAENIHAGSVHDGIFALRMAPGEPVKSYIDARVEGVELTYAKHLPRLEDATGQLTIYDNRLAAIIESGHVTPPEGGQIDGTGTRFVIPDLRAKPASGEVTLAASGPLVAALSYLDSPKLEIMRKAGKPVQLGEGHAEVTGRIVVPLKRGAKRDEMEITAQGVLTGVSSDEVVPGKTLSSDRLLLDLDDSRLVISGPADMSGVPFEGSWTQPMAPDSGSRVAGEITLSEPVAKALGLKLAPGTITGSGKGQLTVEIDKGQVPRFSLASSLAGVGLSLPQIGWSLSQGGTGTFEVEGRLSSPVSVDRLALKAAGLDAAGSLALDGAGQFRSLTLPRLRVGGWLDASAVLSARGRGAAPAVRLTSGRLDMRRAPFGTGASGGGGAGGGGPITVDLDRLDITDTMYLTAFKGAFQSNGGLDGSFEARVGGTAPIKGRIIPQHGRSAMRLQSRDAGDVLAGAGIFRNVQDGTFDLTLTPVQGRAGEYDGALEIEGARLKNAPAITGLLDAVSVVGLIDELNGSGLFFSEVEARFRLTPQQVIVSRSSAVGPSMGISMDGYYNLGSRTMDMQGVLSPVYIINGIGRLFARKGEGLIGFNFNLAGPVDAPRTSVNPLSVFTPGMFRDIFRRPPPSVTQ